MSDVLDEKLDKAIMETIWISQIDKKVKQRVHPYWFDVNGQTYTFGIDTARIRQIVKDACRLGNNYEDMAGKLMTGQEWLDRFIALAPRQLTKADNLDFNLHDDDPEGNCYYAYNCAIGEMKRAARKAAGLSKGE